MESMHIINRCRALASGACLRILAAIGAFWLCCLVPAAASTLHPGDRVVAGTGDPQELPGRYALAGLVDAHAHPTASKRGSRSTSKIRPCGSC